jgi:hypothetical protein
MPYDATSLAQVGVANVSPDAGESGIWQGDAGPMRTAMFTSSPATENLLSLMAATCCATIAWRMAASPPSLS